MDCQICSVLQSGEVIFDRGYYLAVKHKGEIYCGFKDHITKAEGCDNCKKGYIRRTIYAMAHKHFGHGKFYVKDGVRTDHYYLYTEQWGGG